MGELVIGKYIRLSQADRDLMKKEGKTESESISHQRDLIQNYIDSNPELCRCRQEEFFDDGFSGTNFDRPSFELLIDKIKSGAINCVVVKDFSRFGRDYIELGDYLERIFPFLGVRFISVNDCYDSNDYKGTTGGLDVAMKNIVYDYYSKDLSMKVKTAKRSKMKQGKFLGGHVPYGLKKHATIKGKLAIDEEAAIVVRKIFDYALEGNTCSEIARKLNAEGIETPGQYYCRKHPEHRKYKNQSDQLAWTATKVRNMLTQEMYYGAVVGHKREKLVACGKATRAVPKDQQIIMEGMHDPIVSKEDWLQAQRVIRPTKKPVRTGGRDYPLKGLAVCGCCGRKLQYYDESKTHRFKCDASMENDGGSCYKESIPEIPINEAVFQAIHRLMAGSGIVEKNIKAVHDAGKLSSIEGMEQIRKLQSETGACDDQRMDLIELLNTGEITKEEYMNQRDQLASRQQELKDRLAELQRKQQAVDQEQDREAGRFLESCRRYRPKKMLNNEMAKAFVEKILIYTPDRIEIKWNFSDDLLGMME